MKKIGKYGALLCAAFLLVSNSVWAVEEAVITRVNTKPENDSIFAEISFAGTFCRDYELRFTLTVNDQQIPGPIPGIMDEGGYLYVKPIGPNAKLVEVKDNVALVKMDANSFYLAFPLPRTLVSSDSVVLCLESYVTPYVCYNCGISGTNYSINTSGGELPANYALNLSQTPGTNNLRDTVHLVFLGSTNIEDGCPYSDEDLVACRRRPAAPGDATESWEAYIVDRRDCNTYRIVSMPDGRWWMAQNLAYNSGMTGITAAFDNTALGNYYYPTRKNSNENDMGGLTGSGNTGQVYGYLYSWRTAMCEDGCKGAVSTVPSEGLIADSAIGRVPSTIRGICPEGWFLPSDYDFGKLANVIEGCVDESNFSAEPCKHNPGTSGYKDTMPVGIQAGRYLKANLLCPKPSTPGPDITDCVNGTTMNASYVLKWIYRRHVTGDMVMYGIDKFGFSAMPTGYRTFGVDGRVDGGVDFGAAAYYWTSGTSSNGIGNEKTPDAFFFVGGRYQDTFTKRGRGDREKLAMAVRCVRDKN